MSRKTNVTIQKDNNLWKVIRVNGKCAGTCESLSEIVNTCNSCNWIILNAGFVMEQLYLEEQKNKTLEYKEEYKDGILLIGISKRDGKEYSIIKENNKFYFAVENKSYEIENKQLIDDIFQNKIKCSGLTNNEIATLINRIIMDCFEAV